MALLQGVTRGDLQPEDQGLFDALTGKRVLVDGVIAGPFGVLLHSPEAARRAAHLGHYFRFESGLNQRLRHLVALVVASELDCQYEFTVHARLAREEGIAAEVIEAISRREAPDGLEGTELAAMLAARQLVIAHRLDQQLLDALVSGIGTRAAVDLVANIGFLTMIAGVMNAFDIPVQPGHEPELPPRV